MPFLSSLPQLIYFIACFFSHYLKASHIVFAIHYFLIFIIALYSAFIQSKIFIHLFSIFRKLHPCSQLGVAELELEFQDGSSRTFMASVVQVPYLPFSCFSCFPIFHILCLYFVFYVCVNHSFNR
jgi:hypothetical protein